MEMNELLSAPIVLAIVLATVALLAVFLIANGIAAWYDERSRRAVAVVRSGGQLPAAGLGTFHGVAHNFDARSGGELVRREQTQVSSQVATGLAWQDRGCVVTARPFLLVLEGGVEIEIDAREPRLVGFPETSSGAYTNAPWIEENAFSNCSSAPTPLPAWPRASTRLPKSSRPRKPSSRTGAAAPLGAAAVGVGSATFTAGAAAT
ncbi:MAG: hypothetical protein ACMG6S_08215, partial [Byssovorax sp.]